MFVTVYYPFLSKCCLVAPQCLTLLEDSIKREFLSVNYETSSEILSSSKVVRCDADTSSPPWIPRTAPAVALRLMDLDASIYYALEQKETHHSGEGYFNVSISHLTRFFSSSPFQAKLHVAFPPEFFVVIFCPWEFDGECDGSRIPTR